MKELLKIYRDNQDLDFDKIWEKGIFFFDTNVLLDLYRLPISAKDDLLKILENKEFNKRICLPFQTLQEFLNNRQNVIREQKTKYNQVEQILEDTLVKYNSTMNELKKKLNDLKLEQKHSSIKPSLYINDKNIEAGSKFIEEFKNILKEQEAEQNDIQHKDELKDKILNIFNNKIQENPLFVNDFSKFYKEAEERYKQKIPPGYEDEKKEGVYTYKNNHYKRKFGDLFLWKEIMEIVKTKKIQYAVLITSDIKEDWIYKVKGQKAGVRKELLDEIYTNCPDLDTFHMYDTSSFLFSAQTYIDKSIKDESVEEAKNLNYETDYLAKVMINDSFHKDTEFQGLAYSNFFINTNLESITSMLKELEQILINYSGDYVLTNEDDFIKDLSNKINSYNKFAGIKLINAYIIIGKELNELMEIINRILYVEFRMKNDPSPYVIKALKQIDLILKSIESFF